MTSEANQRWQEILEYARENFSDWERLSLAANILHSLPGDMGHMATNGWQLTRQGGGRDEITISLEDGVLPNQGNEGTITFYETKMPRSKLDSADDIKRRKEFDAERKILCGHCRGNKKVTHWETARSYGEEVECPRCKGTGEAPRGTR